ncbi:MAG: MATE family efflux transporter [Vicinamibacterales bacterium]
MIRLAVPVIMAELGWMAMGVVDTIMVGPLGPEAIATSGISNSLQMVIAIFGMGILLGLDTLVSHAYGARQIEECHRWLFHGIVLALALVAPLLAVSFALLTAVPAMGFHPTVAPLVEQYYAVLLWSTVPLLFYAVCRRYLQATRAVTAVMIALITANIINALGNWIFVYGHYGMPALGVRGSALATLCARLYMAASLIVSVVWYDVRRQTGLWRARRRIERVRLRRLVALGLPAAGTITLEVGVFAAATALAGRLTPAATAAHQIALNIAAVSFMIPLGLASAGAVRVGHAIGAGRPRTAAAAGWSAIALGTLFMTGAAIGFVAVPRRLIGWFTLDPQVLDLGAALLLVAAVFQLFDGVQGVATGVLRGLGDTRTPMIANLAGHWLLGLPVGYMLCFAGGLGAVGLWIGLSTGLIVTGVTLLWVWHARINALVREADLRGGERPQSVTALAPPVEHEA